MTRDELAQALQQAVRAQHFEATPDGMRDGAPLTHFPSLDLALIAFPQGAAPVWANVLFSREHSRGVVAEVAPAAGTVQNIAYVADRADARWRSEAWLPEADWSRLLWLLDADAPPAPWRQAGTPALLSAASRARIRAWLDDQALHEVLSSTALAGVAGCVPGLPAALPTRWIDADGGLFGGRRYARPADVRPACARAEVQFAHKTGTTENYASDAGIVRGIAPHRRHYIVALLTNLGTRYAPGEPCATTWRIPALGAAIDAAIAPWLEGHA